MVPSSVVTQLNILFAAYWPYLVFVASFVMGAAAALHAAMTKRDVRAAIAWVGIVLFSPIFGPLIYFIVGINRVRRERRSQFRDQMAGECSTIHTTDRQTVEECGQQFGPMKTVGDQISLFPLVSGNTVVALEGGDQTYPRMLAAIHAAQRSIVLQTYIFDVDPAGDEIADALIAAKQRGVVVRVLIDAIGSRYSRPPMQRRLARSGIKTALFMITWIGLRLPYANLRSHRKILIVDGQTAFAGGMNIRADFVGAYAGDAMAHDAHFQLTGPIVAQLMASFMRDWKFTTQEDLGGHPAFVVPVATTGLSEKLAIHGEVKRGIFYSEPKAPLTGGGEAPSERSEFFTQTGIAARCVLSGPDLTLNSTHDMLMGALSVARHHVRIQSPYFLPDQMLIGALATAARRGVTVDIVIPGRNNLRLVNYAMTAQLDQVVRTGCRVWRASGNFDHAKLMTVDGAWSYVGSSNLDPRSLRLNFELDIEIYDRALATWIDARIDASIACAQRVTLQSLRDRPFIKQLRDRIIWLATPYL